LFIIQTANAAETYPVYISQGGEVASIETQAVSKGGVTYLPMRILFEGCNASVQWNSATWTITATRLDGAVLKLDMRKNTAELTAQGKTEKLQMPQKGYIQNGTSYLPLRFVGEALHCGVIWDNQQKIVRVRQGLTKQTDRQGQSYLLDLYSGDFYRGLGAQAVRIGNSGISDNLKLNKEDYGIPENWQLDVTEGGNYILRCDYGFYGGMTHTIDFVSYINANTGEAHFDAAEQGVFCQQAGDIIYMRDKTGAMLTINDKTGTLDKIDLPKLVKESTGGAEIDNILPLAMDGDYVFFRSNSRLNLLMFDIANKKLTNMKDVLITDEVAALTGYKLDDPWWKYIDPYAVQIEGPYLSFVKLEDGILYAELRTYMDFVTVPLEYKYR
jgi:hypothetical protein